MRHVRRLAIGWTALSLAAAGCGPTEEDVQQLKEQQTQILEKLTSIEKALASGTRPAGRRQPEDYDRVYPIPIDGAPIRGNPNATVTIVEFADFQCPFCAAIKPLLEQTLEKYGENVRIVYKHFPLSFHPAARPAAIASMAAQEQGRFWELHDVMLDYYRTLSSEHFEEYATKAGLDLERFVQDVEKRGDEYERRVALDHQHGLRADVRGTPTIYVNGRKLPERSLEGISALIDKELGEPSS